MCKNIFKKLKIYDKKQYESEKVKQMKMTIFLHSAESVFIPCIFLNSKWRNKIQWQSKKDKIWLFNLKTHFYCFIDHDLKMLVI